VDQIFVAADTDTESDVPTMERPCIRLKSIWRKAVFASGDARNAMGGGRMRRASYVRRRRKFTMSKGKTGWSPKPHESPKYSFWKNGPTPISPHENHSLRGDKFQTDTEA